MKGFSMRHWKRFFGPVQMWMLAALVVAVVGTMSLSQPGAPRGAPAASTAPAGGLGPDKMERRVEETAEMSWLDLMLRGGVFMIPITFCSLLGLALILERFISLRRSIIIPPGFMDGLRSVFHPDRDDREAGVQYCHTHDCPIGRVLAAGIGKLHRDAEEVEQAIEDTGANEVSKLRRNLRVLYSIPGIATMLGLLGTVSGMIKAFQVAYVKGLGRAEFLAKGIYEALVTTYAGLIVAIPILVFYYYFLGRIERIVSEMNDVSVEFLEHYAAEGARSRQ